MKFSCEPCNYATDVKFCFQKHENSKRHFEKVSQPKVETAPSLILPDTLSATSLSNDHNCPFCNNKYTKQNLARHKNACSEKKNLVDSYSQREKENEVIIKELKEQIIKEIAHRDDIIKSKDDISAKEIIHKDDIIKNKEDIIKSKDETILTLTHENANLKALLNNAGVLVEKSISTLNYITKTYTEAPALEYITNISELDAELAEELVVESIIDQYRNNTLIAFLGNLIVKTYKKADPAKQSVWNSDTDRLTYIIRTLLKNKSHHWQLDKKGIETADYIIKPILVYIKDKISAYIATCELGKRTDETEKIMSIMHNLNDSHKILCIIEDNTLTESILKYIAPRMHVKKKPKALL